MKRLVILFALISACFAIPAHADNIQNFYLSFDSRALITGYITVDTTTGTPLSGDVFVYSGSPYNTFLGELNGNITVHGCGQDCDDFPDNVVIDLTSNAVNGNLEIQLPTSLVGYKGGPVCSGNFGAKIPGCSEGDPFGTYLRIGDFDPGITGSLVPTPEPSTLLLLGSGGFGLLGAVRRRLTL
jgi:hypothetical protein